jgi:hypothetical protein
MEIRECCFRTIPEKGRRMVWEITHSCTFCCDYCFQAQKRVRNPTRVLNEKDIVAICRTLPKLDTRQRSPPCPAPPAYDLQGVWRHSCPPQRLFSPWYDST